MLVGHKVTEKCRFTIDHFGIDMIEAVATGTLVIADPFNEAQNLAPAAQISGWNAAINSGQEWLWKKNELLDRFEQGNVNIIERTLRANATFIVAGNNVARVIRQLPSFKPAAVGKTPPTGPYKMGTLDNRVVIHDPFLSNSNRYIMGYKGDSFLTAGFVYAPYLEMGLYRETGIENSINCWKLRCISKYEAKKAA